MEQGKGETILLQSKNQLGLIPSQILYVEGYYDELFNQFITGNFHLLEDEFKLKGYEFIYLPKIDGSSFRSSNDILEMINYFYPSSSINQLTNKNISFKFKIESSTKTNEIFSNFGYNREIHPGFLRLIDNAETTDIYTFEYYQLDSPNNWAEINNYVTQLPPLIVDVDSNKSLTVSENKENFQGELMKKDEVFRDAFIKPKLEESKIRIVGKIDLSLINQSTRPKKKSKEKKWGERAEKEKKAAVFPKKYDVVSREYDIIYKIKTYIIEARQLGIYEDVIREALETLAHNSNIILDNKLKFSRLFIDSNYRIFLPDYGNMEVKMTTLPKSLFILFLWHPEGIVLKQLSDYEPELMKIYQIISKRENLLDMSDSIKRICSPLDSSVNEKLSRIREAFVRNISEKYAEYYYVTGDRGEKKRIKLNRELMSMPEELKR